MENNSDKFPASFMPFAVVGIIPLVPAAKDCISNLFGATGKSEKIHELDEAQKEKRAQNTYMNMPYPEDDM